MGRAIFLVYYGKKEKIMPKKHQRQKERAKSRKQCMMREQYCT